MSYMDKKVLFGSKQFILGLQNILKGIGVKKNPKNRQKTWRWTFWRSLCRIISHQKIILLLFFWALSICTDLLIFLCLQRSPLGCVLSAWDEAKRKTGDALKLKMTCVGSPPRLGIPHLGLNQAGRHGRFEWVRFIGWAVPGDVCDWAMGWMKGNS